MMRISTITAIAYNYYAPVIVLSALYAMLVQWGSYNKVP